MPARFLMLAALGAITATALLPGQVSAQSAGNDDLAQPASVAPAGVAPAPAAKPAKRKPLFRHTSVDAAWKASQKSGRPLMVFITSKQCHFCDKMVAETWSHPQIARAVATRFEPVALLKENNLALVKELGVRAYPTTIVVSTKGELAGHIRGFADPQKFATTLLAPPKKGRLDVQPASYGEQE